MAYQKKTIGEYIEKINFADDPNIYLFFKHIQTGLLAFANQQQTAEESFAKYKVMLRIAEGFLSKKFGVDFNEVRKQIERETKDEAERLSREVMYIAELLDTSVRKVELQIVWSKDAQDDEIDAHLMQMAGFVAEEEK